MTLLCESLYGDQYYLRAFFPPLSPFPCSSGLFIYSSLFSLLVCLSAGSQTQFPITQNVTVVEGSTANMTCRVDYNDNTSLQWSNPAQQTLFFGDKKGECGPDET